MHLFIKTTRLVECSSLCDATADYNVRTNSCLFGGRRKEENKKYDGTPPHPTAYEISTIISHRTRAVLCARGNRLYDTRYDEY